MRRAVHRNLLLLGASLLLPVLSRAAESLNSDASDSASGIYIARLDVWDAQGNRIRSQTLKLLVVR